MTDPQPYTLPPRPFTADELEEVVRSMQPSGIHTGSLGGLIANARMAATLREYQRVLAENEGLRADALRWRAVREDLCVDWIDPGAGKTPVYWRIDGNNYDYYRGPIPATVEDAADWLVHRAAIDAARSGGEG